MADPDFEKLVERFAERQRQQDAENVVDWEEMRRWRIEAVHDLFNQIETWLRSLIESGSVRSSRGRVQLTEEDLGLYEIESLELSLASLKLTFEPVGILLLGAYGRIEVKGPNGKVVLLLLDTDSMVSPKQRRDHVAWFIAHPASSTRPLPRLRSELRQLTQETFQQLFSDLFGITH